MLKSPELLKARRLLGRAANVLLCRVGPALALSCSLPVSRSGVKTGRKVHATEIKHKGGREILK